MASLYRYIREHLKPERDGRRAFTPYEIRPGEQMLYDWSDYSVKLSSELLKDYVHLTELGWSRYKVLWASMSIIQSDILEVMEDAFFQFGGVASRIQVDDARAFVDDASIAHLW